MLRSLIRHAAGALVALAALAMMPRPDAAGRRLVRGRTLSTAASGGRPGEVDALAVPGTITANGQTAWLDCSDIVDIIATLTVGGATGTTPTLDVVLETADSSQGNVRTVAAFTQKTGASSERKSFPGLDALYRFRWTVGGTTPSFTGVTIAGEGK